MNPTPLPFDGPRLLRAQDQEAANCLSQICFENASGDAPVLPEPTQIEPIPLSAAASDRADETYAISVAGRLVSQISIFTTPLHLAGTRLLAGHIGGVCTHPSYRGHHFAGLLLAHCAARLAHLGAHFVLISGERGLYRRAGCVEMGRFYDFQLTPGLARHAAPASADSVSIRRAAPADANLAARLYAAETVHFARTPEDYAARFRPHRASFEAEEWIIDLDGQPAAYALLNTPYDVLHQDNPRVRCVLEYAGSRVALAAAAGLIIEQLNLEQLRFPVAWQDSDLRHLLQSSTPPQPGFINLPDHTLRLLNFPAFMRALQPYSDACLSDAQRRALRVTQSGPLLDAEMTASSPLLANQTAYDYRPTPPSNAAEPCDDARADRFGLYADDDDSLVLNGAAMSALVFGDPAGIPNLPGAAGRLAQAIFPLPAFELGLDYH